MQHFKVHYSIRSGPGFIHFTGPGRIKAGFYSLIFDKKKSAGAGFMYVKAGAAILILNFLFCLSKFNSKKIIYIIEVKLKD
jgi:hypothetical protein